MVNKQNRGELDSNHKMFQHALSGEQGNVSNSDCWYQSDGSDTGLCWKMPLVLQLSRFYDDELFLLFLLNDISNDK